MFLSIFTFAALAAIQVNGDPTCPKRDGQDSVYIPHEDCTKFWQCSNGTPYLFDCPANLHFNPSLNVCDWPDQAGCDGSADSSISSGDSSSSEDVENNSNTGDDTSGDENGSGENNNGSQENNNSDEDNSSSSSDSDSGSGEGNGCPAKDGDDSVYIPHEDCTKFWQCSNGVPILQNCPDGLNFNPELNVCDWPDQAGCNGNSDDNSSSSSDDDDDDTSGQDDNNTSGQDDNNTSGQDGDSDGDGDSSGSSSSSSRESGEGECPAQDGENSVYIPDADCSKFWQCSNGVPILQNCPAGLHFNPQLNVCDWPEQAGCDGSVGSSETVEDPSEETVEEPSVDSSGGSSGETSGECPAQDGDDSVYIPHEDCTKFWQCSNGVPILQICPDGLNFNPSLNVCDWPDQAGCSSGEGSSGESSSGSSDSNEDDGNGSGDDNGSGGDDGNGSGGDDDNGSGGDDDNGSGGDDDNGSGGDDDSSNSSNSSSGEGNSQCPEKDGENSVYIPHEDCTKFWQCSNGTPYLFDCPANLHFNPTLNVCDWPEQAGCNGSGGDSSEESSE